MTKQEAIENVIKDIRKHLEENEYCTIRMVRKGKEIKGNVSIFNGDFNTVTTKAETSCKIESEIGNE